MEKTKLKIHTWPEKILRKKCKPVTHVDETIRRALRDMHMLMVLHRGVGLAANQAGLDMRLIVVDAKDRIFKLVNPRITKSEGSQCLTEGCLSFPGMDVETKRAKKVWVSALDEKGNPLDIEASDLLAVIFQHEIDHINGIVFIDRMPLLKKISALPARAARSSK